MNTSTVTMRTGNDVSDEARSRTTRSGMVRVLHVITGDLYAGAERVQELLAARLPEFGYDVSFACLKEGTFQQRLVAGTLDVSSIVMRSRFDLAQPPRRLVQYVRSCNAQIIHTHTVRGALLGAIAAAVTGVPLVHHVHSPTARDTTRRFTNQLNAFVEKLSLQRAKALIPVSNSLAHHLSQSGYSSQPICTVHNGVPASDLSVQAVPGRSLVIGMVALFRPRKGIEVLLRALSDLKRQGLPVQLRAIGEFESRDYQQQVLTLSSQLGVSDCIEWRGFRSDVLEELTQLDALVLPSLFGEGLPMVVLEAMAVGLPVIASEVEGMPEAIREGSEGLLVRPGNTAALTKALTSLANDPLEASRMGESGRRRQRAMFSDAAMARQVSQIYDRVLASEA